MAKMTKFLKLRLQTGLDRQQFAEESGVSYGIIRRIELGENVRLEHLYTAVKALSRLAGKELDVEDFLGVDDAA